MKKKALFTILTLCMVFGMMHSAALAAGLDDLEQEDGWYLISSTDDWNTVAAVVKGGSNCAGLNFKLTADINVTTPIGCQTIANNANSRKRFAGNFDGAGLIKGYPDGTLRPKNDATRAEVAAIIQRFCEIVAK